MGFVTGSVELNEMLSRGKVDLCWRRVVMVENRDAERDRGPSASPGWICREAVWGICGIVAAVMDLSHRLSQHRKMIGPRAGKRILMSSRNGWASLVVVVLTRGLS